MEILIVYFIVFCIFLVVWGLTKKKRWMGPLLAVFNLLIIELVAFVLILGMIYKADCFFLIGNQKSVDILIKARLTYSLFVAQHKKTFFYRIDPYLGYTVAANKESGGSVSNSYGMRALKEYPLESDHDVMRLAAFGDSYVFCDDENTENSWPYIMEEKAGNLEVLNFGVSGYGLAQSYTRYLRDGSLFQPDVILFNYILVAGRDYLTPEMVISTRNLRNAYLYRLELDVQGDRITRRVMDPFDLFDPEFRQKRILEPLGLDEIKGFWKLPIFQWSNVGLIMKNAMYFKKFNESQPTDPIIHPQLNEKLLRHLLTLARMRQTHVIFLYRADKSQLPEEIQALLEEFRDVTHYVNFLKAFEEKREDLGYRDANVMNNTNHYNRTGNEIYGELVLDVLKSRDWKTSKGRMKFNNKSNAFMNSK